MRSILHKPKKKTRPGVKKSENGARLKKLTSKQAKKVQQKEQKQKKLPSSWKLLKSSVLHVWKYKKLFLGISLIYGVFYVLLVKGITSNFQLDSLRANLEANTGTVVSGVGGGLTLYGLLLGSANSTTSEVAGAYQMFLFVVGSLVVIRALRLTYAEKVPSVKESFYTSTEQFIPFLIVFFFLLVQLMPALLGTSFYTVIIENGIASNGLQQFGAAVVMVGGILLSLYFLSSTVLALYIVTLGGTPPRAATKTARSIVKYRRKAVVRKMLFLPLFMLLLSGLALVPLIMFVPVAAEVVFLIAGILLLAVAHSYYYALYRSLI